VTPFVRRHRTAFTRLGAVAAVAMLAVGGRLVHLRSLPPEDDGTVTVVVIGGAESEGGWGLDRGDPVQIPYTLIAMRSGDSVQLLGLQGPGVRDSAATEPVTSTTVPNPAQVLTVVPDCDDPALLTATTFDYRLRVVRTDAVGRSVTAPVDVPLGSDDPWPLQLQGRCIQLWFAEHIRTERIGIDAVASPPAGREVRLALHLYNALPADVFTFFDADGGGAQWPRAPNTGTLAAEDSTMLGVSVPVLDCLAPESAAAGVTDVQHLTGTVIPAGGTRSELSGVVGGRITLVWTAAERRRVREAVTMLCSGTPAATVQVASAVPARDEPLSRRYLENGQAAHILRLGLHVVSSAARVTVSDPSSDADWGTGALPVVTTARSVLRRGSADPVVDWAVICEDQTGPPTVQLALGARGGTYPGQVRLSDPVLAAAYARACPGLSTTALREQGWRVGR